uniref:RNA silencing suppressor n=2 Tax=Potato virus S TaxID=12169 RepID=VSR_PVSP|nr:RecName: Full=RNA silencing suppressor; AltName: Full=10.7 kDa protein; AltName: Full=Putative nucleic acid-binding protein [Potato virus S (strain Peruvian)]BAA00356.1 11K protein [Potato virus S]CAI06113.1 11K protein [Potato virus S]
MKAERLEMLLLCVYRLGYILPVDVCIKIISVAQVSVQGRSTYSCKRRARSIGRCWRCYRVYPPVCNSKCDNRTCRPGISPNFKVVTFIRGWSN